MLSADQNKELVEINLEVSKYSPQIFIDLDRGRFRKAIPEASSVLIQHGGNFMILTAGHVLASSVELGLALGDKLYPLHRDLFQYVYNTDQSAIEHAVDFGIIMLESDTIAALQTAGYIFITRDKLELGTRFSVDNWYLLFGYPANRIRYKVEERLFRSVPYSLLTHEVPDRYESLRLNPNFKLVLEYRKRRTFRCDSGTPIIGPNIKGVSGAGLWCRVGGQTKLAAILTDWYKEESCLSATRLGLIVRYLDAIPT